MHKLPKAVFQVNGTSRSEILNERDNLIKKNTQALDELNAAITIAAKYVGGKDISATRPITEQSDVLTRTILEMAGINTTRDYPHKCAVEVSTRYDNTMYLDYQGLRPEDQDQLLQYLQNRSPDQKEVNRETGNNNGEYYDSSFKINISTVKSLVPELDKKLDVFASSNDIDLLRLYKEQSENNTIQPKNNEGN